MPLPNFTKVAIMGAGQFGFAIAYLLAEKNKDIPIRLFDTNVEYVKAIEKSRKHPVFHQGVILPKNVTASADIKDVVQGAELIVLSLPGQFVRGSVPMWSAHITNDVVVVNVAKAMEKNTNTLLHDVVEQEWAKLNLPYKMYFAGLAGGMIAEEVTTGVPIAADVACEYKEVADKIVNFFATPSFRLHSTTDVLGLELASAFKNVVAIGAGMFDGMKLPTSSKAAFISMLGHELWTIAKAMGAQDGTFQMGSHTWIGDLLTTCFGPSRNRLFGEMIGQGMTVGEALASLEQQRKIAEGYFTTKALNDTAKDLKVHAPLLDRLTNILFYNADAKSTVYSYFQSKL